MASRKPVLLPPDLAAAVEEYRFVRCHKTESDAIRCLIKLGLDAEAKRPASEDAAE
jgi:hypothetical protein